MLDLIVENARIDTGDARRPRAGRLGVFHGRIVGLDEELGTVAARRRVDLGGRFVLPGFIDAHTHLVWQGRALGAVDLSGADSVEAALDTIAAAARASGEDWIDVTGYDQRRLGRHLSAADLDRAARGRRVYVNHISGHACLVSSAVLAEVPAADWHGAASGVHRDGDGAPSGLFFEVDQDIVRRQRLPYAAGELAAALRRAGALCAAQGVTFCAEAGVGAGLVHHSPVEVAAYQSLAGADELAVRVQLMVAGDFLHELGAVAAGDPTVGIDLGLRSGFGGGRLSLGAAKFWLDGGMSARTAALSAPYVGGGGSGALTERLEDYRRLVPAVHGSGWQLALHAIGDAAIDAALELIEDALAAHPHPDARPRIEHCGLVRPDQITRLAAAGAIAVVQPAFLTAFGDDYAAIVGEERAGWLYRGRRLLDAGVTVAGSSDRPVTPGAPLEAIAFFATRAARSGALIGPEEAISVEEALRTYGVGAARACRVEAELGTLAAHRRADLVVLAEDPRRVPAAEIADIPVCATLVGGRPTHDPDGLFDA